MPEAQTLNTGIDTNPVVQKNTFPSVRKLCIALAFVVLIVYGNTLQNGYVMDDVSVIEKNTFVTKGFAGIPQLFITGRLEGFAHVANDNYRPLSLVMFAIEYQVFGANPTMSHLFNILFFAGCVILLFLCFKKLFNRQQTGLAFITALLFALHPIHTEVVANVKSRDELMCFFFAFAALIAFMGYAQHGKPLKLLWGAALLLLSFLSKETVISFLAIVPLVFFFYQNEHKKRSLYVFTATIIVSVVFLATRAFVLKGHDSGAIPFLDNPLVNALLFTRRIPTAIMVLGMYLRLLLIPYPLISDYSYNSIPSVGFGNIAVLASLVVYLLLIATGIYRLIKRPKDPLAFGILFFLSGIALFSNIIVLVYSEMAERLVFFASAGFCLGIATVLWALFFKPGPQLQLVPRKLLFIIVPLSLAFAALTINRNSEWSSNYSLFSTDAKKSPGNARLWHSLGYVLLTTEADEEPDQAAKNRLIHEGIADLQKSISIYPGNFKVHQDLGNFFRGLQQYDSAEVHLKEAIRLFPESPVAVSDLGFVYFSEQKYREALALSEAALLKDKQNTAIINNMAICYLQMKEYDSALIMVNKALLMEPGNKLSLDYKSLINKGKSGN